ESIATAGAGRMRIELHSAPAGGEGELAVPLSSRKHAGWLYGREGPDLGRADLERMAEPLGRLVDVAFERREVLPRSAEVEAARRPAPRRMCSPAAMSIRSSSTCPATCRSCRPTQPSWSGSSRT